MLSSIFPRALSYRVRSALPLQSIKDLIALSKTKKDGLSYASADKATLHLPQVFLHTAYSVMAYPVQARPAFSILSRSSPCIVGNIVNVLPQVERAPALIAVTTPSASRPSGRAYGMESGVSDQVFCCTSDRPKGLPRPVGTVNTSSTGAESRTWRHLFATAFPPRRTPNSLLIINRDIDVCARS